jgi:hypothetical protein
MSTTLPISQRFGRCEGYDLAGGYEPDWHITAPDGVDRDAVLVDFELGLTRYVLSGHRARPKNEQGEEEHGYAHKPTSSN